VAQDPVSSVSSFVSLLVLVLVERFLAILGYHPDSEVLISDSGILQVLFAVPKSPEILVPALVGIDVH